MQYRLFCLFFFVGLFSCHAKAQQSTSAVTTAVKVKEIKIIETNNQLLDKRYRQMPLPDSINTPAAKELKEFSLQNGLQQKVKDIDLILEMLRWVSSRWTHNGNNAADTLSSLQILKNAQKGMRYRCVEYGKVMAALLRSFGFISRTVGLKAANSPYGPPGRGHFATEVWSDDLAKWIFLDPQNSIYVLHNGTYLNYYDMYQLRISGKFDEIKFTVSKGYTGYLAQGTTSEQAHIEKSKAFLSDYWGSMDIPVLIGGKLLNLSLALDNPNPFLTFQGFPSDDMIFTSDPKDLYFPVNQNTVVLKFSNARHYIDKYNELINTGKIKNWDDQYNLMHQYAPIPKFLAFQDNNMPWFSHYEMMLNGKKLVQNNNGYFEFELKEGMNELISTGYNKNGKKGSATVVKFLYE